MSIFSRLFRGPDEGGPVSPSDDEGGARGREATAEPLSVTAEEAAQAVEVDADAIVSEDQPAESGRGAQDGAAVSKDFPSAEEVTSPMELGAAGTPIPLREPPARPSPAAALPDEERAAARPTRGFGATAGRAGRPVGPRAAPPVTAPAAAADEPPGTRTAAPPPAQIASQGRTMALGSRTPALGSRVAPAYGAVFKKGPAAPAEGPAARPSGATLPPRRSTPLGSGHAPSGPPVAAPLPPEGSVDEALERLFPTGTGGEPTGPARAASVREGTSTATDQAALRATFEALAVGHVMPIRNFMIELRYGQALASWIAITRPALRTLREMAGRIELRELVAALDLFDAALEKAAHGAQGTLASDAREALLGAYAPLITRLPRAFELEGERDRREPIIVQGLLQQVPGLEPLMIERLCAAGLGRLDSLFGATVDDLAAVAGLPAPVAAEIRARVQEYRRRTPAALASPDPSSTRRELEALLPALVAQHAAFERAAQRWSGDSRNAKREARRDREMTFLQIKVALARLGDIDFLSKLEKLPFGTRIEELQRYLREAAATAALATRPASAAGDPGAAQALAET